MRHESRGTTTTSDWAAGRIDERIVWLFGFVVVFLFYLATTPHNRFEAGDGYAYAYDVENRALTDLYDTRLLLFHVVMRLIYRAVHAVHDGVTGHAVLLMVSGLSASLCLVLFARLLNRHFGLSLLASLLGTGFLGATYGFWRYSFEAEVYAPALFLITAVLFVTLKAQERADKEGVWRVWWRFVPVGTLAGIAVLFYQPNAIPLFLALPVLFLRRGGFPQLFAYAAAGGSVILLGYVIAFIVDEARVPTIDALNAFLFKRFNEFVLDDGLFATVGKSLVAFGHQVVSGNWFFGLDLAGAVNEYVPLYQYKQKLWTASKAGALFIYLPLLTLTGLLVIGVCTTLIAVRARQQPSVDRRLAFAFMWIGLWAIVVGRLSPGNPEVWIIAVPPLVILFAAFVIEPCVQAGQRAVPTFLLIVLVLHNGIGGIGIFYGAQGDYLRAKGAWVLDNATADDLILLSQRPSAGFIHFLCYVGGLRVASAHDGETCLRHEYREVSQLIAATRGSGGRIFVFENFFEPPDGCWHKRNPDGFGLAERFCREGEPIFRSDVGTTYLLPANAQ